MSKENEDEIFSEDPEEQMKIENDILKLKLQAELGGDYESEGNLPPEIENAFLKNVIEFEHQYAHASNKTLYEVLGNPSFEKAENLSNEAIEIALDEMEKLMSEKGIEVDYAEDYDSRLRYIFVTEELFLKESPFFHLPGMTMHYVYEEFHPNHKHDIKKNAESFFENWVEQNFNDYSSELAKEFVMPTGETVTREELLIKFQHIFDSFTTFQNTTFNIDDISFELSSEQSGKGFAEGMVGYDAVLENGEIQHVEGAFKLYMDFDGWWNIYYFVWPGFIW